MTFKTTKKCKTPIILKFPAFGTTPVCVGICYAARKRRLNLIIASMPLKSNNKGA